MWKSAYVGVYQLLNSEIPVLLPKTPRHCNISATPVQLIFGYRAGFAKRRLKLSFCLLSYIASLNPMLISYFRFNINKVFGLKTLPLDESISEIVRKSINPLKSNDIYICHTAALTSRRYILNIYSTNKHTEYFKHAA